MAIYHDCIYPPRENHSIFPFSLEFYGASGGNNDITIITVNMLYNGTFFRSLGEYRVVKGKAARPSFYVEKAGFFYCTFSFKKWAWFLVKKNVLCCSVGTGY